MSHVLLLSQLLALGSILGVDAKVSSAQLQGEWWQTGSMYQIYPRSFQDSDGDGTGDLRGIMQRLPYLKELGVGFIWLSPVMKSPMRDFGYDISDFSQVDPLFGSMQDMKELIKEARAMDIRILMDFVPNHVSNDSAWFQESRSSKTNPKRDWFIWHPGKVLPDGTRAPPNNWALNFGGPLGSSWIWDETTQEYYYSAFSEFQPDLNYRNPEVVAALQDVIRFWMRLGVGGFRIDAVPFIFEDPEMRDEPLHSPECFKTKPTWNCMDHIYTQNVEGLHSIIAGWRKAVDEFEGGALFGETYNKVHSLMTYYGTPEAPEFHVPFNFLVLGTDYGEPNNLRDTELVRDAIREYAKYLPDWCQGNWVLGNHDNHRLMERLQNDTVLTQTIYTFFNLIPGTPTIYNGDELTMRDHWIPYEACVDPMCLKNPDKFAWTGRDPERSPIQWDSSHAAGFTTGRPWLPVNPNYVTLNAELEKKDPDSSLSRFTKALKFRTCKLSSAYLCVPLGKARITNVPKIETHFMAVEFSYSDKSWGMTIANWDSEAERSFYPSSLIKQSNTSSGLDCVRVAFSTNPGFDPQRDAIPRRADDLVHMVAGEVVVLTACESEEQLISM